MAHITTYLDIESCKILRSGFNFTSNLTSAIGNLANRGFQQAMFPAIRPWPMTTAEDNKLYKPITKDIVDGVTHELTLQDVENDPNWITKSTCIVTSNVDRTIINAEAAKAFGKQNNVPVLRWRLKLSLDFSLSVEATLYDEDE